MSNYNAYRRCNERDIPKPSKVEYEWVICRGPYSTGVLPRWPNTADGERQAEVVANLLNKAYHEGQEDAKRAMRQALGIEDA